MATASTTPRAESAASMIGHINFDRNPTGKRSAGKPPATFDAAGTDPASYPHTSGVYNVMMSGGEYGSQKGRGTEPSVHE